jgi:hypothetical protein
MEMANAAAGRGGHAALIRVVTTRADIPRVGEGIAFVHGELEPKISTMDGNKGFAMALDRSSRRYVGITAWSASPALEAGARDASGLIADLAGRLHGSTPSVEVFDLVLAHVLKPVRVEYWGRLTRLEVPVPHLSRAVRRLQETVLAVFEHCDGLAGILLFVDADSGVIESIDWFDRLHALRASAARARELHELLVADVPEVGDVELSELQVVIAETRGLF